MSRYADAARLAREAEAIARDWSDARVAARTRDLELELECSAVCDALTQVRAVERRAAAARGEARPVLLEGEHLPGMPAAGEGEAAKVRQVRRERSARDAARVTRQEAARCGLIGRGFDAPAVMGPARSYLPRMLPDEQAEASYALGRERDVFAEAKAARDAHERLIAEMSVCTGGKVIQRPRSRRSTRGKGRKVRR